MARPIGGGRSIFETGGGEPKVTTVADQVLNSLAGEGGRLVSVDEAQRVVVRPNLLTTRGEARQLYTCPQVASLLESAGAKKEDGALAVSEEMLEMLRQAWGMEPEVQEERLADLAARQEQLNSELAELEPQAAHLTDAELDQMRGKPGYDEKRQVRTQYRDAKQGSQKARMEEALINGTRRLKVELAA